MCFSEEASFTASAVLTVVGIATLKETPRKSFVPLALIPLLFAFQQFTEGLLWIYLPSEPTAPIAQLSKFVYMFFAYLFWPIFVPFALFIAEPETYRKKVIQAALIAGCLLSLYFFFKESTSVEKSQVHIVGSSIMYSANDWFWRLVYTGIILVACFASSLRGMAIYGLLVAASFFAAVQFYEIYFVSVWCFFAAILSVSLFGVIRLNR